MSRDMTFCANKKRVEGYWKIVTVFNVKGFPILKWQFIKDTSSKLCRSDEDIPKQTCCQGCTKEQDVQYFREQGLI